MKQEVNIPTELSELKLWQYQQFMKLEKPTELDMISIFLKVDKEIVRQMELTSVEEITQELNKMFEGEGEFHQTFKMGSQEFGFIPSLDDITFGENSDIVKYIKDWGTMHNALAVMYRPITMKRKGQYVIEEYQSSEKYAELMRKAPLSIAMGAMVFFYLLTSELLDSTLKFMETEVGNQLKQGQISGKSGENIVSSLKLLKETLGDLKKYRGLDSMNASST